MLSDVDLETLAVRSGTQRSEFGEHSEAVWLTSSFTFKNAAQAAARFAGEEEGDIYTRFSNPTVTMLQKRLAALEGGEACVATASGMSAILSLVMATVSSGQHILASSSLFGSTWQLMTSVLPKFGIDVTLVSPTDLDAWRNNIQANTRLLFVETPSNPCMQIADIAALSDIAKANNALLAVDNCFCTPVLQQPLGLGADVVVHSATKYLDGQGRVIGGAVVASATIIEEVFRFMRTAGPCISPFNAWVILKGLETLPLRMRAQSDNARALAHWLTTQNNVTKVYYPELETHPGYALAMAQQSQGGAVVSFVVKGGREAAWRLIDQTQLISITGNLGDTRTTITHPATTTHGRVSEEVRQQVGIEEGLVRISVGLEALSDLQGDLHF